MPYLFDNLKTESAIGPATTTASRRSGTSYKTGVQREGAGVAGPPRWRFKAFA